MVFSALVDFFYGRVCWLQAGLSVLGEQYSLSWMRDDPDRLETLLASQTPWDIGIYIIKNFPNSCLLGSK